MAKRTPLIAGNWKMNKGTAKEAATLIDELLDKTGTVSGVEIVVCPPSTVLYTLKSIIGDSGKVALGAQDVYWKAAGAYTGQLSPEMLADAGVAYVLIGHSERRGRFGVADRTSPRDLETLRETDASVNRNRSQHSRRT
jgi:triosephosphate isomerase